MRIFTVLFLSVYGLDLGSKILVRAFMPAGAEIHLLPFFSLSHVKNSGIAFGLFPGWNAFFIGVGLLAMAGIFFYSLRLLKRDRFSAWVLAGVLGGALGNLTDRIIYGEVTDFLDFYWRHHHWPSFNVADSSICVGMALLIWKSFSNGKIEPHVSHPL